MITAVMTSIENQNFWSEIISASFPINDFLILTALIGTTVVPYNLFLHAALAKQKWQSASDISGMRIDTISAVFFGILVSICIIIVTANVSDYTQDVKGIGLALKPLFGEFSTYLVGLGYISAGLTSSITAPLASAYVLNKLFSLNYNSQSLAFKRLSYSILFVGCVVAALDFNPIEVIKIAQVANAVILPILVILLIWLAYNLKSTKMSWWFSIFGFFTLALSISISFSSIYKIFF
jgi:manganese transport protein